MHAATVQALDAELKGLAADERRGLVRFLRGLDLLDREHGFEQFKCVSAFEYLVQEHHLPEGTAWRRVNAMRLIRRFPSLEAALGDGRLNPTQLGILGPVLTPTNLEEVVREATHRTKRQTEELAVSIVPKRVPAPGLRQLPAPRPAAPAIVPRAVSPVMGLRVVDQAVGQGLVVDPVVGPVVAPAASPVVAPLPPPAAEEPPRPAIFAAAPRAAARIFPVAKAEWQWRLRMDEARMAKLGRLKGLLAHVIPDGDLDRIFDRMLDDSLAVQGKSHGFVEPSRRRAPAAPRQPTPGERAPILRHVRRAVLKRDGFRCTWVHPDGSRCEATARLEMDHLEPARESGASGIDELVTRCRHHNQLRAIRRYGRGYVLGRIDEARRAREARRVLRTITGEAAQESRPAG